ncbi:MAG: DUF4157 domain-containing protein [Oscillospiraceae bacterium]|nr:DUF4157 domain-containing protein [Oscillospiraceae bacterium]
MEAKLQQQAPQKAQTNKPNLTGIPTQMKLDFEQRSGLSFDDVRVHYNSDKPAQLQALAYTQGTQVYVGPRQERHLPHELGHVVQQKHQKISPTHYIHGVAINSDSSLEKSADVLAYQVGKSSGQGAASIQMKTHINPTIVPIIQMHMEGEITEDQTKAKEDHPGDQRKIIRYYRMKIGGTQRYEKAHEEVANTNNERYEVDRATRLDAYKFSVLEKIAKIAKVILNLRGVSCGPHIALSKVHNSFFISINSCFDPDKGVFQYCESEQAKSFTTNGQKTEVIRADKTLLNDQERKQLLWLQCLKPQQPQQLPQPKQRKGKTAVMEDSLLEYAVKIAINFLAYANEIENTFVGDNFRELADAIDSNDNLQKIYLLSGDEKEWLHHFIDSVTNYFVLGLNETNTSVKRIPQRGSVHGEMIVVEYILENEELDFGKKTDCLRVIRLGGTLPDCATCNAHFYGGSLDGGIYDRKQNRKVPVKTFELADRKTDDHVQIDHFPKSYSERLLAKRHRIIRSKGSSGDAFPNVVNFDDSLDDKPNGNNVTVKVYINEKSQRQYSLDSRGRNTSREPIRDRRHNRSTSRRHAASSSSRDSRDRREKYYGDDRS